MNTMNQPHGTLVNTWFDTPAFSTQLWLTLAGAVALWLSAKIQIPFYLVPMTMQTLVVLVIGLTYGRKLAAYTLGLYLAMGMMGLPVFAGTPVKGIGIAYMIGPTGGYLVGFLLSAVLMGYLGERGNDKSYVKTLFSMCAGIGLVFLCGVTWLSSFIGLEKALQFGVYPFLPGEVFKIVLVTLLLPSLWKLPLKK